MQIIGGLKLKVLENGANYFKQLYDIDVSKKVKQKNKLNYLSWAAAWAEVKKNFPDSFYTIYKDEDHNIYHSDGKTCWVETGVTINELEHIEYLPVMDFKNQSVKLESVTSSDVNKAIQRSLTKACARHGVGLYIYEGDDLPEETKNVTALQTECFDLLKKKAELSESAKAKVTELCKNADKSANGDPRLIDDSEVLETLKKSLIAVRK